MKTDCKERKLIYCSDFFIFYIIFITNFRVCFMYLCINKNILESKTCSFYLNWIYWNLFICNCELNITNLDKFQLFKFLNLVSLLDLFINIVRSLFYKCWKYMSNYNWIYHSIYRMAWSSELPEALFLSELAEKTEPLQESTYFLL